MARKEIGKRVALELGYHRYTAFAAIPMISFLNEHGFEVREIIGTGAGAFAGALISKQTSSDTMMRQAEGFYHHFHFNRHDFKEYLKLVTKSMQSASLFTGNPLKSYLKNLFNDIQLDELPIPLTILATDSLSIESVHLKSGNLANCLYAANVAFPYMPPEEVEGRYLVSGFYSETLPVFEKAPDIDWILSLNVHGYPLQSIDDPYEKFHAFFERTFYNLENRSKFEDGSLGAIPRFVLDLHINTPFSPLRVDFIMAEAYMQIHKLLSKKL